jgi:phosphoglycolate phosphatase
MNEIKAVLFDLDGTLLDTLEDLADATNYILKKHGYPERSLKEVRSFLGSGAAHLIRSALPCDVEDAVFEGCLKEYVEYYRENSKHKTAPYPGILALLAFLKGKGIKTAVVSNKPDAPVKVLCADYFGDIYALGERPDCPRKPAPDMIRRAMAQLGIDSCIYVGDSDVDVTTAKNAGMPGLFVLWGFRDRQQLEAAGAENFCDDPGKLADMLLAMLEK